MIVRSRAPFGAFAFLCTLLCAMFANPALVRAEDAEEIQFRQAPSAADQASPAHAVVTPEDHHDVLPSLRNAPVPASGYGQAVHFEGVIPLPQGSLNNSDGAINNSKAPKLTTPSPIGSVDGVGNGFSGPSGSFTVNSAPPDTVGAIGATQYVQVVNSGLAVFDKTTKTAVYGPVPTKTLWSGFGGGCQTNNDGDAVVVYDKAANRWVVSQFSVSTTPYLECVAVSQTSDATGAWYRYSFSYGTSNFPDYPKMGVWPDGYYTTFNVFAGGTTFAGSNLCAYDRAKMLIGAAATQQCFQTNTNFGGILPSDLDGATAPPANAPNYMLAWDTNSLDLWKFHVDWTTPANSTITPGINSPIVIPVSAFSPACGGGTCVTQPGVTQKLDSLADRLMFRVAYRNFGTYESLVVSHSVGTTTSANVRWYELRSPGAASPVVFQQQTIAPDTSFRWMPSIAMDQQGNIAVGYSVSSKANSVFPSISYSGRQVSDPVSTMGAEVLMFAGAGSQT